MSSTSKQTNKKQDIVSDFSENEVSLTCFV